jgi:autotransporter-associated beta strand protein
MRTLFVVLWKCARPCAKCGNLLAILALVLWAGSCASASASPPPGYYLVWSDEFNEPALNTNNWTYWQLGTWGNAVNVTNAVSMNGSNMVITTYTSQGTNYTAMLASQYHFHPRYGYYESSIMWSNTNGNWSAYWLRSPTMGTYLDDAFVSGGELDICEHRYVGDTDNYIANTVSDNIHWDGYGAAEQGSGSDNVGNVATGFHAYGLLWSGDTYSFSIDGSEDWNASGTATPLFGSDAYIILSSQVNDTSTTWAGYIPTGGYGSQSNSIFQMTVDYCRYYAPTNVLFWTGASSAYWNNSANWVSNMALLPSSDLTFSYISATLNSILNTNETVDGLVFLETAGSPSISGTNTLTLGAGGIDMVAANQNATLNAPVSVALNQTWRLGRNNPGNYLTVNSSLSGTATLTKAGYGTLVLGGTNSFSGVLDVDTGGTHTNDGAVLISGSAAIASVPSPIFIRNTGMAVSTLQFSNNVVLPQSISLAGRTTNAPALEAVAGVDTLAGTLNLTGGGSNYVFQADSGSLQMEGPISAGPSVTGPCVLTFQGNGNIVIPGSITDGSATPVSLLLNAGTLTLSGPNTYSGPTTIAGGALIVNGSLASPVTVLGGSLAGIGTVADNTVVQNGEISPGTAVTNSLGTLTFLGSVTLGSGAVTAMAVNAAAQTNAQLHVTGTLNFGGTLYVVNTGGKFSAGESFALFKAGNSAGTFSTVVLPFLGAGLAWNTNSLANGLVSVIAVPRPAAPTSAYAAAIRARQPAGYWPLQETNAPGSTAMETNLGSLGSLGNAYYIDTTSAGVTLDVPGAIAGDPDTAAAFSSADQTCAFVPRASPALTLEPPFTLEAWFNPQTTVYGVILGEGGGAALNGGPTYGGFQFAWAGNNKSWFETQLYHYGINASTTFDTPTGYADNTWYHYVFTYDTSSNAAIYINGQVMATNHLAYQADTWSPFTIGNGKWNGLAGTRAVNGTIDEVAVYTNLLSSSDIANHYNTGVGAGGSISYKQLVLNDNPLLYLRMDNPGSTAPGPVVAPVAVNFGSAPVDGEYLPGTVPAGVSGPAATGLGSAPAAALLNGVFSCVDASYDPSFNPANGQPFTVLLWFKGYPADSSTQALMSRGTNSWALNLTGSNGKLVWSSGAGSVTSTTVYNDGAWHQAAGVYDGAKNYLYVDGALQVSGTATGSIAGNTNDLYIGGDPGYTTVGANERYFAGAVAQAAFFTNALSLAQIQTIYQAAVAPPPLSLGIQSVSGTQMEINWNYGTLQSATNVSGPYTDLSGASQPYAVPATNSQSYFRVRM